MRLSTYNGCGYNPGGKCSIVLWFVISRFFFETSFPWPSFFKSTILRIFGSKVGQGVVIKPNVKIKYPWNLSVGHDSWIGERVWIDNLESVSIGSDCCLSQASYFLTGNHDYKKNTFDLILGKIVIEDKVWVGAKCVLCPNVLVREGTVLAVGSVLTSDTESGCIYQGNPAAFKRNRC